MVFLVFFFICSSAESVDRTRVNAMQRTKCKEERKKKNRNKNVSMRINLILS